jgi:hypothetical protein
MKLSRRQVTVDKKLESANERDIADEHTVCTMHVDDKSGWEDYTMWVADEPVDKYKALARK